ncbi:MAG: hypothetical protein JXR77_15280 [Lentisphaeria bacterium]|nr:hypothetical protein [Lentisphaeria bacterium]
MTWLWLCCCGFVAALAEVIAGSRGLVLPLVLLVAFYGGVVAGWRRVLPSIAAVALMVDLSFGRTLPATVVLLGPVLGLAMAWRQQGDCRHLLPQVVVGASVGAIAGTGLLLLVLLPGSGWGEGLLSDIVRTMVECVAAGAVLHPLLCRILDHLAAAMDLPVYGRVRHGGPDEAG